MKCPKCGYLGFEPVDRCRNCGYDFSLGPIENLPELPIRPDTEITNPLDDLAFVDAASSDQSAARTTEFAPHLRQTVGTPRQRATPTELPLFGPSGVEDVPLITKPSPPRAPLAVRRATPEVPRPKSVQARMPMLDLAVPRVDGTSPASDHGGPEPATVGARVTAVAIDFLILTVIDALVVYLTMQICGLTVEELGLLPKGPLVAFLLVQNGGYLAAFTAGGQTLGKMVAGIRVVSAESNAPLDLGHSIVRTLVWVMLAIPAGLGFITALFSTDRRGLHDRCAGAKVIRAAA
jgi:uncharacterized RDD family membrane protein YckC